MSISRAWRITARDLRLGPRSPVFLFAIFLPIGMSFLISAVFGGLLDPDPRLGIVDEGSSALTASAQQLDGVAVSILDEADDLRKQVEAHDLDAGIILAAGFDSSLRAGNQPDLEFLVSGESLASSRIILAVSTSLMVDGITT